MFYYIEGTVTYRESGLAVIDAGGVGYACNTSLNTLSQLETGQSVRLYTYLHVREDIFDLYGFIDREELNFFKMLISVSGIGPKVAMSMLSQRHLVSCSIHNQWRREDADAGPGNR